MASLNGHVEVVNILLQNGAHVDVQIEVNLNVYVVLYKHKSGKGNVSTWLIRLGPNYPLVHL